MSVAPLSDPAHREAAHALLDSIRLREPEIDRHLECALSPEYWRALVPDLSVGAGSSGEELVASLDPDVERDRIDRFPDEGWLATPPLLGEALCGRMRGAVLSLMRADWPPVFAWVYDEFWRVPRAAPLTRLLGGILGVGFRQTPHIWTHVVAGRRGSTGWRPHVDHAGPDARLTVWIALSDATIDSGCMCVIPRSLVPPGIAGRWQDLASIDKRDVLDLLHASRPLPVRAGSILGWDAGLVHWGSARQASGEPRMSISMEFVPPGAEPAAVGSTLAVQTGALPSHEERLAVIARGIALYQHGEPRTVRYAALGERLLDRLRRG